MFSLIEDITDTIKAYKLILFHFVQIMLEWRQLYHDSHSETFMTKRIHVLFALIFSIFFIHTAMAAENLDGVVAVVNSTVITQSDLGAAITQAKQNMYTFCHKSL